MRKMVLAGLGVVAAAAIFVPGAEGRVCIGFTGQASGTTRVLSVNGLIAQGTRCSTAATVRRGWVQNVNGPRCGQTFLNNQGCRSHFGFVCRASQLSRSGNVLRLAVGCRFPDNSSAFKFAFFTARVRSGSG